MQITSKSNGIDAETVKAAMDNRAFYEQYFDELSSAKSNGWIKNPVRCPFHDDNRPSFTINLSHGGWKCWAGCGSGDAFQFHQKMTGATFPEALRALASFAGILDAGPEFMAEMARNAERRRLERAALKRFNRFQTDYSSLCGQLIFEISKLRFETMAEAEKYADAFHIEPAARYHIEVLSTGDDSERVQLYREWRRSAI